MSFGKVIELFLVEGTADKLITAELSNWNGKAIKIPRIEVAACDRDDFQQTGVYFLFCKEDDDSDSVYIGEAENIKSRLMQHLRDFQNDKEPYFWNTAVAFIGRDLNKALIRYLEDRLVGLARQANRYAVLTKSTFGNTVLKESDRAVMDEFLENIKVLISALGYKVLEPLVQSSVLPTTTNAITPPAASDPPDSPSAPAATADNLLYLSSGSASAKGMITAEGFVVLAGSIINQASLPSLTPSITQLRSSLMKSKVQDLTTTEDLLFSSPSAAARFVLGFSSNGLVYWKDASGRTLKELSAQ